LGSTKVEGWLIGAYSDDTTGQFSHCGTAIPYRSGISLIFSVGKDFAWFMGLANPQWDLKPGAQYDLTYSIDAGPKLPAPGQAVTTHMILIPLVDNSFLFEQFRRGYQLFLHVGGDTFTFNLNNSGKALAATLECTKRHVRAMGPTSPPSSPATPGNGPSASRQTEGLLAVQTDDAYACRSSQIIERLSPKDLTRALANGDCLYVPRGQAVQVVGPSLVGPRKVLLAGNPDSGFWYIAPGTIGELKRESKAQPALALAWEGPRPPMPTSYANRELTPQEIFRAVAPSVYLVIAGRSVDAIRQGDGVLGSAVAVSADSAITNCHVIENLEVITLVDESADKYFKARAALAHRPTDRCFLKVDGTLNPIAAVRDMQSLAVGERVYTIGNPSGLAKTLGEGLISGLRRMDGTLYVQTTAQISEGSSGGALVDSRGGLVGITTAFLKDAQNLNFAIAAQEYWTPSRTTTASLQAIAKIIRSCVQSKWNPDDRGTSALVKIRLRFNPNGTLADAPQIMNPQNTAYFLTVRDSAIKAVQACEPFPLPSANYELWKDIILNFDPNDMQ
jgi:hypothetical protein